MREVGRRGPVFLNESFYLLPEEIGAKRYSLLVKTLAYSVRMAFAQLTKNHREDIVLLLPRGNGLMVHFLYYIDEVTREAEFDDLTEVKHTPAELKLASN